MIKGVILAREKNISVYDAVFIILAEVYRTSFWTADKKLYEKVKGIGFVEFLGIKEA